MIHMKRSTFSNRKTPMRQVNPERAAAEKVRQFGALAEYVRTLPCAVCGRSPVDPAHVRCRRVYGAWLENGDGNLIPLCRTHHNEQHSRGIVTFQEAHNIDMAAVAAEVGRELQGNDLDPEHPV